jgi:hypothetical protein
VTKFTDKAGRAWDLVIEVPHLRRLREEFRFEPAKAFTENAMVELLTDPERLVGVLYTVCEEQAEKAGVTPEQFARGFDGAAIDGAFKALIEAVADFSPLSKAATKAGAGLRARFDRIEATAMSRVTAALTALDSNDSVGS